MLRRHLAPLLMAGLLAAACTKPTPYAPAGPDNPYGYSQTEIDDDTVRIEVAGNSKTPRSLVENQLLYRAAQIARTRGDESFVFITRDTERRVQVWQDGGYIPYGWGFGFGAFRGRGPYYGGFGYSPSFYGQADRYTAYAEARFFTGDPPAGEGPSYNADQVLEKLRGKVNLPPLGTPKT